MGGEFQDHFFPLLHCGVSWRSCPCFHRTLLIFRSLCACDKRWNVCVDLCSHGFKHQVYCFNSITIALSDMLQYFFNHLQNAPITTTHSLVPRLHPLWCILAREGAWSLISCECSLISKWLNERGLDKPHTHDIWYLSRAGVVPTIVDSGLSIQRSDAGCDGSAVELALFKYHV